MQPNAPAQGLAPQHPSANGQAGRSLFGLEGQGSEPRLDLLEYWRSITKRKWAILAFALLVTLLAGVVVFAMTPVYRATTTILIESSKAKVVSIEDVYSGISQNREHFQTQVEILKSREVALKTIRALRLWEHPHYDPRLRETTPVQQVKIALGLMPTPEVVEWNDDTLADAVIGQFQDDLSVEPVRLSQLARIHFESPSPELSARAANMVAKTYVENDLDARLRMTQQANGWLNERMADLKTQLAQSEAKLQAFRERTGLVDAKGVAQSGVARQIDEISQRLVGVRLRSAEIENAYQQIKGIPKGGDFASLPVVLRAPNVNEAKRVLAEAERRLAEVSQRYGYEHPRFIAAKSEVESGQENVRRQVESVVESVTREYEVAVGTEKALEASLEKARGQVQGFNRREFELGVLEREVQSNREMYDLFMRRAKETNNAGDMQSAIARVVDQAITPSMPIKPKKAQIMAIALVLALFLGALAALLIDQLDNTLKNTGDVESKLKAPLLASLPVLGRKDAKRENSVRLVVDNPHSVYAESIRTARTGVLLSAIDETQRVLLVTSSLPGEGKTTFSVNLALAHAQTQRTLLIDADMRRPAITKGLELPPAAKGLSQLVAGAATLDECIHHVDGSTLAVLPAGTIPPNPQELLLSHRFKDTLARLRERFDVIVIDSPPVELVSDAQVIAPQVTGVIYVSRAMATPVPLVRKGLERIRRAGGDIMGVVLNQFDFARAEKYHGEYSGYGKYGGKYGYRGGYGNAYGAESQPKPGKKGPPAAQPAHPQPAQA